MPWTSQSTSACARRSGSHVHISDGCMYAEIGALNPRMLAVRMPKSAAPRRQSMTKLMIVSGWTSQIRVLPTKGLIFNYLAFVSRTGARVFPAGTFAFQPAVTLGRFRLLLGEVVVAFGHELGV